MLISCGIAAILGGGACDKDPAPECQATYEHLLVLAKRHPDAGLMQRFVTACRESFDPERLSCIREAKTAGEALACKPVRKRPS